MASIINASTAGAGGVITTADASGVLQLQTAGATAVTVDASQNVTLAKVLPEASGGTGTTTGYYGFKNRIINGAMVIDQRNAGASVTPANGQYTIDRWAFSLAQASKLTCQQNAGSVTPPAGYTNYLGITSSSAYTVGAGENFNLVQRIEGFNVADLGWGTASAQTVTLSFWVRSSLTGTFGGVIQNSANNRSYPFTYTISAANTWEYETITIAGDTTGTWVGATNGIGLAIWFGLGVGSSLSGTAGAWSGSGLYSATGATSVVGTNGATFYITGVQLEKGSTATSFDYRPYGTELALCQRYFELTSTFAAGNLGINRTDTTNLKYQVTKRASPTVAIFGTPAANTGTNTIAGNQLDNVYLNGAGVFVGTLSANAEL
jgi:hypothetical protein